MCNLLLSHYFGNEKSCIFENQDKCKTQYSSQIDMLTQLSPCWTVNWSGMRNFSKQNWCCQSMNSKIWYQVKTLNVTKVCWILNIRSCGCQHIEDTGSSNRQVQRYISGGRSSTTIRERWNVKCGFETDSDNAWRLQVHRCRKSISERQSQMSAMLVCHSRRQIFDWSQEDGPQALFTIITSAYQHCFR